MREPTVLDMRHGPVDHACSGSWDYVGLNAGGHEIYRCDSGRHIAIGPHVAADHTCTEACMVAATPSGRDRLGPDTAPHCRAHIQFRSDCEACISERQDSNHA